MIKKTKYIVEARLDVSEREDIYGRKMFDKTTITPWAEYGEYCSEEEAIKAIIELKNGIKELYSCRIRKITITDKIIREVII